MTYGCPHCERRFSFKSDLDRHDTTCRFFYMQHRLAAAAPDGAPDAPPAKKPAPSLAGVARQMAQLTARMDALQAENARLRADVERLKGAPPAPRRARAASRSGPPPGAPDFEAWAEAVVVDERHLACAGRKGIIDAVRLCVGERLAGGAAAPLCAREQRAVSLYVYREAAGWTLMVADDLNYIITCATRGLVARFVDWQRAHAADLEGCARTRDAEVAYMGALFDTRATRDQRRADLKQLLLETLPVQRKPI